MEDSYVKRPTSSMKIDLINCVRYKNLSVLIELDLQVDDSYVFLTKRLKATITLFSLLRFPLLYVPLVMNSTSGRINKVLFLCVCRKVQ